MPLRQTKFNKMGFSFLEILISLFIISIIGSIAIPPLINKKESSPRKRFVNDLSGLVGEAATSAINLKKVYQILFDFKSKKVTLKVENKEILDDNKHKKFSELPKENIKIPDELSFKNFSINGMDEMEHGDQKNEAWFYIMPDGTSQGVVINIEDAEKEINNLFSIVINPFYSQVKEYDSFQKP